jgi:hypothetical protein
MSTRLLRLNFPMPTGAIEAVFAAEIGLKIVNFGGHSASQNGKRLSLRERGFPRLSPHAKRSPRGRAGAVGD